MRKGEKVPTIDAERVIKTVEQFEIYEAETSRPPFAVDVLAFTPEAQEQADAEKRAWNAENGYDDVGNIIAPLPE